MDALPAHLTALLEADPALAAVRGRPAAPAPGSDEPAGAGPAPARPAPSGPGDPLDPELLHPALWLGHQLGRQAVQGLPSGFPALDLVLPGGGWPRRVLTELLLPHPGVGELRLLARTLAVTLRSQRPVMLFDPPAQLSAPALQQLGIDPAQLLIVNTRTRVLPGTDSLWALEQSLRSGHVGAVVAWLPPRLRAERLRRLQLAAQSHDGAAFVVRELAAAQRPTAAPLRLALRPGGGDRLLLHVLKRRGPPLPAPLALDLPPVLGAAAVRRLRNVARPRPVLPDVAEAGHGRASPSSLPGEGLKAATFINLEAARR